MQAPVLQRALPPSVSPASSRLVGLGLALERQNHERLTYVEQIIPGFAAHKSGHFMVNLKDILTFPFFPLLLIVTLT